MEGKYEFDVCQGSAESYRNGRAASLRSNPPQIIFVDDDPAVCKAVGQSLTEHACEVQCFTRPAECLAVLATGACDLLITDLSMPAMDGIELMKAARQFRPLLPILLVTGYGDIPVAVKAVKAGAFDFIEKPLDETTLLPVVFQALKQISKTNPLSGQPLTEREREILQLIVDGKSNKEMAVLLHCSVRTVENHRFRLMHKLNMDSTAGLVKLAIIMGLARPECSGEAT